MEMDKEDKFERWILERLNLNKGKKKTNKTNTIRCKHKDKGLDQVYGNVYLAYAMIPQRNNMVEEQIAKIKLRNV